jgi:hypothetical protein
LIFSAVYFFHRVFRYLRYRRVGKKSNFAHICNPVHPKCLSGGTGRRARLKIVYRKVCRFDSGLRYFKGQIKFLWFALFLSVPPHQNKRSAFVPHVLNFTILRFGAGIVAHGHAYFILYIFRREVFVFVLLQSF